MKVMKKPIEVDAYQLIDSRLSIRQALIFMGQTVDTPSTIQESKFEDYCHIVRDDGGIFLKTLESDGETQLASFGDYIIKGVQGEYYPIKPDIFEQTYDIL